MEKNTSDNDNDSVVGNSNNEDDDGSKSKSEYSSSDAINADSDEESEDENSGGENLDKTKENEDDGGCRSSSEGLQKGNQEECDDSEEEKEKEGNDDKEEEEDDSRDGGSEDSDADNESDDYSKHTMVRDGQKSDKESGMTLDRDPMLPLLSTTDKRKKCKKPTKPGIIYMSRIPPFMKPKKLHFIFGQYGEIGRIFLQQEDKNFRKFRKKKGGNKSMSYTEGWIEFKKKKTAKRIAITFNNTRIGDKKRSRYYDDLWNIKYLPKFQWAHLMERLEYEKQVRQQRIRTEVMQAKKETNFYLKSVEQQKVIERMKTKKRKQGKEWDFKGRNFKQWKTEEEREEERRLFQEEMPQRSGKVTSSVLGKIFKK